jgi:polysaccharide biosynthesis transport protein
LAQPESNPSVTLRDYALVIWLRKWLVAVVIIACPLTAFLVSNSKTRVYTATALLTYQQPADIANPLSSNSSTDVNSLNLQVQSVVNTINSPALSSRARDTLGAGGSEVRGFTVTASILPPDSSAGSTVSDVVAVTAESTRPALAAAAANAYAQAVIDLRVESEQARLRAAQDAITAQMKLFPTKDSKLSTDYLLLAQRLRDLQVAEATTTGDFKVIQPATTPDSPSAPKPFQSAAVGFGVGLFAGIALAFVAGQFDTRVRSHREVGEILNLPGLGRVPHVSHRLLREGPLVTLSEPTGPVSEALRMLRSNLDWSRIDHDWRSLLITSTTKAEGKTFTLCNLAVTLALAGKKVVVVDADLRDPRVHTAFSLPNGNGLTSVIQGSMKLPEALKAFPLGGFNEGSVRVSRNGVASPSTSQSGSLLVLTSGPLPPNPGEIVASHRLATTIKDLSELDADYVLIDSPPVLSVGDAGALASSVDCVLFVANIEQVRRPALEDGREALDSLPCRKLGLVVVGERLEPANYYHYGGS